MIQEMAEKPIERKNTIPKCYKQNVNKKLCWYDHEIKHDTWKVTKDRMQDMGRRLSLPCVENVWLLNRIKLVGENKSWKFQLR